MKIVFCLRLTFCVSDLDSRDEPGASFAQIWLVDSVNYDRCSETDSGRGKNFSYSSSHLLDKQWHAKPYFCLENVTAKWLHWSWDKFSGKGKEWSPFLRPDRPPARSAPHFPVKPVMCAQCMWNAVLGSLMRWALFPGRLLRGEWVQYENEMATVTSPSLKMHRSSYLDFWYSGGRSPWKNCTAQRWEHNTHAFAGHAEGLKKER